MIIIALDYVDAANEYASVDGAKVVSVEEFLAMPLEDIEWNNCHSTASIKMLDEETLKSLQEKIIHATYANGGERERTILKKLFPTEFLEGERKLGVLGIFSVIWDFPGENPDDIVGAIVVANDELTARMSSKPSEIEFESCVAERIGDATANLSLGVLARTRRGDAK